MEKRCQFKKTGSVDQTQLDSASESEEKWANYNQYPSVFVQKVMLVGYDWWFSIQIFLYSHVAEKPLPMTWTCTDVNFHNLPLG